ncbi:MAG TPA: Mur ligase family protein [Candidatus Paceibacterota bacterium]
MNTNKKKRYYIIGIAGVAMGNLAGLLKQKGYEVAGSDQEMYEPMKSMLAKEKISVFTPYSAFHVKQWRPGVVVVGNAISRGNPELEFVMNNGHSYRSVSDILMEEFIEDRVFHGKHPKKSIVIAGTHGKTTTSALVAWILENAGLDPTVFVGGITSQQVANVPLSCKLGKGKYVVLEGDEYDTAFFDKNPKILHYRPFFGLLNNIELDHVDIYRSLDHLRETFKNFIKLIPKNGVLAVNREDKNAWNLAQECIKSKSLWKNNSEPKIVSFGINKGDFQAKNISYNLDSSINYLSFNVFHMKHRIMNVKTSLSGKHNVSNILGAIAIARAAGVSCETIRKGIETFAGVKRRMEIIGEKNGVIIIDDYAHHPTAVSATIMAAKEQFFSRQIGGRVKRIIVIFEPGSASSRRNVFEEEYIDSLSKADIALIYKPFKAGQIKKSESFNGKNVSREINRRGGRAVFVNKIENLMFHVKTITQPGDILLIMSCRGFDGLREKIMRIL